jgi:hypothetical protein
MNSDYTSSKKNFYAIIQKKSKGANMSLAVLVWFALPIGIYTIIFELKSKKKYNALFEDFYKKTINSNKLSQKEKHSQILQLLRRNGYEVTEESEHKIIGEKKILSLGWIILSIGFVYVGVVFYLLYYYFIQKPHRLVYEV